MRPARAVASGTGGDESGSARRTARRGPRTASLDDVLRLIDGARASLGKDDLAAVLVVVGRETELLRRGALPARPRGRLREGRPSLTPAAREHLRPIRIALASVARTPRWEGPDGLAELGSRIERHVADGSRPPAPDPPGPADAAS